MGALSRYLSGMVAKSVSQHWCRNTVELRLVHSAEGSLEGQSVEQLLSNVHSGAKDKTTIPMVFRAR